MISLRWRWHAGRPPATAREPQRNATQRNVGVCLGAGRRSRPRHATASRRRRRPALQWPARGLGRDARARSQRHEGNGGGRADRRRTAGGGRRTAGGGRAESGRCARLAGRQSVSQSVPAGCGRPGGPTEIGGGVSSSSSRKKESRGEIRNDVRGDDRTTERKKERVLARSLARCRANRNSPARWPAHVAVADDGPLSSLLLSAELPAARCPPCVSSSGRCCCCCCCGRQGGQWAAGSGQWAV